VTSCHNLDATLFDAFADLLNFDRAQNLPRRFFGTKTSLLGRKKNKEKAQQGREFEGKLRSWFSSRSYCSLSRLAILMRLP
jgi:hypothetical protein